MSRYPLAATPETIHRGDLGLYLQGAVYTVLHSDMSKPEKRAALEGLSVFARTLAPFWGARAGGLGPARSMSVWFRSAGFDASGRVSAELLRRIEEEGHDDAV